MHSVDTEWFLGHCEVVEHRSEDIDEIHTGFFSGGLHCRGIRRKATIVFYSIGEVVVGQDFLWNRREQHDAWWPCPRIVLPAGVCNPFGNGLAETVRIIIERFVVAKHRKNNGSLGNCQIFVGTQKSLVARAVVKAVAGIAVVADDQLEFREFCLQVGFQPGIVLHAIGETVADDYQVFAGLKKTLLLSAGRQQAK